MYRHLLLYCQSSFPSALLYHQSHNYLLYNPSFSCRHHRAAMLPPCSTDTTTTAVCCCHHPNAGHVCRSVTTKLPPPPLPPRRHHRHHHATASTKLSLSPFSTLHDKFDNEKEFCNNADIDCIRLSQLFQLGIKFLHGGMRPIFDALVCLSLYHNNL